MQRRSTEIPGLNHRFRHKKWCQSVRNISPPVKVERCSGLLTQVDIADFRERILQVIKVEPCPRGLQNFWLRQNNFLVFYQSYLFPVSAKAFPCPSSAIFDVKNVSGFGHPPRGNRAMSIRVRVLPMKIHSSSTAQFYDIFSYEGHAFLAEEKSHLNYFVCTINYFNKIPLSWIFCW